MDITPTLRNDLRPQKRARLANNALSIASASRIKAKMPMPCLHNVDLQTLQCRHFHALVYQPAPMHVIVSQLQNEAILQQHGQDISVQPFHKTASATTAQEKVNNWQSATLKEVYGLVHTTK